MMVQRLEVVMDTQHPEKESEEKKLDLMVERLNFPEFRDPDGT